MNKFNENALAYELADALNDRESLQAYINLTQKYQPEFLRKILSKVMSVPQEKIKRTRGALFTYLVNQNAKNGFSNTRD